MVLAWIGSAVVLAVAVTLMLRALRRQAESPEEYRSALLAYAVPIPGAIVMTLAPFGVSPFLLLSPAFAYFYILLITRRRPFLMLGYVIDRIDRKTSDRYVVIFVGTLVVAGVVGAFIKTAVYG